MCCTALEKHLQPDMMLGSDQHSPLIPLDRVRVRLSSLSTLIWDLGREWEDKRVREWATETTEKKVEAAPVTIFPAAHRFPRLFLRADLTQPAWAERAHLYLLPPSLKKKY